MKRNILENLELLTRIENLKKLNLLEVRKFDIFRQVNVIENL
jgi:hypothetical protein